jgi:hypothetical protein
MEVGKDTEMAKKQGRDNQTSIYIADDITPNF